MAENTYWYRVEMDGTERFIETERDCKRFQDAIQKSLTIRILRQIVPVPLSDPGTGKSGMGFVTMDRFSPLSAVCKSDTERLNLGRIISFAEVDTDNDMWHNITANALGESEIVTPPSGIVVP